MEFDRLLLDPTHSLLSRAYVPYGRQPRAAVALLSDGQMVGGVRVENASISLTISSAAAALGACATAGRVDIVALRIHPPPSPAETMFIETTSIAALTLAAPGIFVVRGASIPEPLAFLAPMISLPVAGADAMRAAAEDLLDRAFAPQSRFRVACLLRSSDGVLVPGVNLEHPEWTWTLCAERVALATALAYGVGPISEAVVVADGSTSCTPCGACRQVFLELAPDATLWMERGATSTEAVVIRDLLPDAFDNSILPEVGRSGGPSIRADDRKADQPPRCC